jgi:hypothetical protein
VSASYEIFISIAKNSIGKMNAFRQAEEKYSFKTKWQQMEKDLE